MICAPAACGEHGANVAVISMTADAQLRGLCDRQSLPPNQPAASPKGDRVLQGFRRGRTQSIWKAGHWESSHSAVSM